MEPRLGEAQVHEPPAAVGGEDGENPKPVLRERGRGGYRRASVFEGREEERLVGHTLPKDRAPPLAPLPVAWGHGLTPRKQMGTSAFPHAKKPLRGRRILERVCPIFVFFGYPASSSLQSRIPFRAHFPPSAPSGQITKPAPYNGDVAPLFLLLYALFPPALIYLFPRSFWARYWIISCEPLLGPMELNLQGIHWVIVGGESGPSRRPVDPAWVRSIRDQCQRAGVPFFFKQWGGRTPKSGGRLLDGRTWDEFPQVHP